MNVERKEFRSGFVAIIGRPNVGKSTLLNHLLGEKVAIISEKPQTTRTRIKGILTTEDYQMVFLDTPGIHKPKDAINQYMVTTALATVEEADVVLFLLDATMPDHKGDRFIAAKLETVDTPVIAVVNKKDAVSQEEVQIFISRCQRLGPWKAVVAISALTGEGVRTMVDHILALLPRGPLYFPGDYYTDQPIRFMVAELIREKIFSLTSQEVPYSSTVVVESFKEETRGDHAGSMEKLVSIEAVIYVERMSQKGILIGKGGEMLRKIGSLARKEIEALVGCKVFLRLWVKVSHGWTDDVGKLKAFGYD